MVQRTNGVQPGQRMRIVSTTPGQTVYRTAPNGNTVLLRQSPARPPTQGKNIIVVGNQGSYLKYCFFSEFILYNLNLTLTKGFSLYVWVLKNF